MENFIFCAVSNLCLTRHYNLKEIVTVLAIILGGRGQINSQVNGTRDKTTVCNDLIKRTWIYKNNNLKST